MEIFENSVYTFNGIELNIIIRNAINVWKYQDAWHTIRVETFSMIFFLQNIFLHIFRSSKDLLLLLLFLCQGSGTWKIH